jgi:hypothetical protein
MKDTTSSEEGSMADVTGKNQLSTEPSAAGGSPPAIPLRA